MVEVKLENTDNLITVTKELKIYRTEIDRYFFRFSAGIRSGFRNPIFGFHFSFGSKPDIYHNGSMS